MGPADSKENLTLVGAGPVGSLLALFLAQKNYAVEVFERRPDMRVEKIEGGRSINLALSTRGLHALKQVGLEAEVLKMSIPMLGRMVHATDGKTNLQRYGKDDSQYINSVSRRDLNKLLMTTAENTGVVNFKFKHRVLGADFERNLIEVEAGTSLDKTTVQHKFNKLIGTDGSASIIRKQLAHDDHEQTLNYGYKELHIPSSKTGDFQMGKNALHIWPRGTYMLIALPNEDASFTATLFLPLKGTLSFASLKTPDDVEAFFKKDFCDVLEVMPEVKIDFFKNPMGHMVTVKCSPWNFGGKGLILGDAAHGMVPFFGQGMNCGFEDCGQLIELLDASHDLNAHVFDQFSRERKTHTDAIADMAVENFIEMRDKVADPQFLLEKNVEKLLQEKFPQDYIPRYQLVTFSRLPYRLAYQAGAIESEILGELCRNIKKPSDIDFRLAEKLVTQKLSPIFRKYKFL